MEIYIDIVAIFWHTEDKRGKMPVVINPHITCRIDAPLDMRKYKDGVIEMIGMCNLTGKLVIRYVGSNLKVFEYDEKIEKLIPFEEGVCKNHFNQFSFMCLPLHYDNVLEYKKRAIINEEKEAKSNVE